MIGNRRGVLLAFALVLSFPRVAAAQGAPVVAESLFQEGKRAMAEGRYAEACPKLAESHRLDPGAGALTALALCHKAEGKTASAWIEFKEVISLARRDGRKDREHVALEAIAELEPKLSRIRIDVTRGAREQEVDVSLDDAPVPRAAYGEAIPANPGPHRVIARAAGRVPFEAVVEVLPERDEKAVTVPRLADEPPALAPAESDAPRATPVFRAAPRRGDGIRRPISYGLAGLGVVSVAVGGIFGLKALSKSDESNAICGNPCAVPEGLATNDDARSAATLANVFIGAGLVAIAAGVILYLTAPGTARSASRF
jgi:tetratricopeptide (TPR) repeat protein